MRGLRGYWDAEGEHWRVRLQPRVRLSERRMVLEPVFDLCWLVQIDVEMEMKAAGEIEVAGMELADIA